MKKYYVLGALALLCAILAFTNPTEEQHKDAVKNVMNEGLINIADEQAEDNGLAAGLAKLLGPSLINDLVDSNVSRDNYYLFSLTHAQYKGIDKILGLGILGKVYLSPKIKEELDKLEKNKDQ